MEKKDYHKICVEKVLKLRSYQEGKDINIPRYTEQDLYKLNGQMYKRLRINLRSNGCSIATCTMCPFPNERVKEKLSDENFISQVEYSMNKFPNNEIVSIYDDGSFFADKEISANARNEIYKLVKQYGAKYLMVESLPNFINESAITAAKSILGEEITLIIGIGLESTNENIRKTCICNSISTEQFLKARDLIVKNNYILKTYILIKPAFFLEEEAIKDAIDSVKWLINNNITDITLCPMRVVKNTLVYELLKDDLYHLPRLTTIAKILNELAKMNIFVRVSLFNVDSKDIDSFVSHGCEKCERTLFTAMQKYNNKESVKFEELLCEDCEQAARGEEPVEFMDKNFEERVEYWVDNFIKD